MKTILIILTFAGAQALLGQQLQIDCFDRNGLLTFNDSENDGETYIVQWSSNLSEGSWQSGWDSLASVQLGSNNSVTVPVPMFYRVVQETVDLEEYGYPFGSTPLTWMTSLREWLTFTKARVAETDVPVYADPQKTTFLGNGNKHYFEFTRSGEAWYEYFRIGSEYIYYFGRDGDDGEIRVDPPVKLPRHVKIGKEYSGSSTLVENGSRTETTISLNIKVVRRTNIRVIGGSFNDVIELEEDFITPGGPSKRRVFYARGIGPVKRIDIEDDGDHRELDGTHRELFTIDSQ